MDRGDEVLDALYHGPGGEIVVGHGLDGWSVRFRDWSATDLGADEVLTLLARLVLGRTTAPLQWLKTAAEREARESQRRAFIASHARNSAAE